MSRFPKAGAGRAKGSARGPGRGPSRVRAGSIGLAVIFVALAPFEAAEAVATVEAVEPVEAVETMVEARTQDPSEAVMVAAGRWALERLPSGPAAIDPHRSGAGKDGARLRRVAAALGTELTTLDRAKECMDVIDPSTCRLSTARLLAIGAPRVQGDRAEVKIYAWHRTASADAPVAEKSWNLTLRRSAGGWQVVSGG